MNNNGESTSEQQQGFSRPGLVADSEVELTFPNHSFNSETGNKVNNEERQRLQNELEDAHARIAKLQIKLAEQKRMTKKDLSEAGIIMMEQMKALEAAEKKQQELNNLLTEEKTKRMVVDDKFKTLFESTGHISNEVSELNKELQVLFQNLQTTEESLVSQEPLEKLSTETELENMKRVVQELKIMLVDKNRENSLNVSSPNNAAKTTPVLRISGKATISQSMKDARKHKRKGPAHAKDLSSSTKNVHVCACGYSSSYKSNFTTHIRHYTGEKKFQCECGERFLFLCNFKQHRKNKHKEDINSTYYVRRRQPSLRNRRTPKKYKNEKQGKNPSRKRRREENNVTHFRVTDNPQQKFLCGCGKSLTSLMGLNHHIWRSSKEKIGCLQCPRQFYLACELKNHVRRAHTVMGTDATNKDRYSADAIVTSRDALWQHKSHSRTRTKRNGTKGRNSSRKTQSAYKKDVRKHSNIKPESNLRKNAHTFNKNWKFPCNWTRCRKSFHTKSLLKNHMVKSHGDNICMPSPCKTGRQVGKKGQDETYVENEDFSPNPIPIPISNIGEPIATSSSSSQNEMFTLREPLVDSARGMPRVETKNVA